MDNLIHFQVQMKFVLTNFHMNQMEIKDVITMLLMITMLISMIVMTL